jgi:hypothetical protein
MSTFEAALRPIAGAAAALSLVVAGAHAAPKPEPLVKRSHAETSVVTVKAVDTATRHLTIANDKGETQTVKVPADYKRLDQVKAGDKIKATYTFETAISLLPAGATPAKDAAAIVGARAVSGAPGAGAMAHMTVTGAILAIDMKRHMLKIVSPQGGEVHWVEVTHEDGRKAMEKLKVGDKITASVTEALLLEVQPA